MCVNAVKHVVCFYTQSKTYFFFYCFKRTKRQPATASQQETPEAAAAATAPHSRKRLLRLEREGPGVTIVSIVVTELALACNIR